MTGYIDYYKFKLLFRQFLIAGDYFLWLEITFTFPFPRFHSGSKKDTTLFSNFVHLLNFKPRKVVRKPFLNFITWIIWCRKKIRKSDWLRSVQLIVNSALFAVRPLHCNLWFFYNNIIARVLLCFYTEEQFHSILRSFSKKYLRLQLVYSILFIVHYIHCITTNQS